MGFSMLFGGVAVGEYRPKLFSSSLLVTPLSSKCSCWVAFCPLAWSYTCAVELTPPRPSNLLQHTQHTHMLHNLLSV